MSPRRALTVYLDTSPLYALADRRDQGHAQAFDLFSQLQKEQVRLVCPVSILLEFHSLMLYKGLHNAHEVARVAAQTYRLVYPSEDDLQAGLEAVAKFSDQGVSLTDAVLAVMAAQAKAQVLTFDRRHFQLMGVALYGPE